jgi:hypothetical protein
VGGRGGVGGVGEVFFDVEIFAEVAEGLFGEGHLAEVVAPGVVAGRAADEGFALYGFEGAVGHGALKRLGWDGEGDVLAGVPEGARELMGEEQGVVAALLVEQLERGLGGDPGEFEAVVYQRRNSNPLLRARPTTMVRSSRRVIVQSVEVRDRV